MQSVRQQGATMHLPIASYVSKTLLVLFVMLVVLTYGYWLFVGPASELGRQRPNYSPYRRNCTFHTWLAYR